MHPSMSGLQVRRHSFGDCGAHRLQFALFFGEELLDMLCGLIVHDVELDLEIFCSEFIKLFLVCFKYGDVVKPLYQYGKMAFDS